MDMQMSVQKTNKLKGLKITSLILAIVAAVLAVVSLVSLIFIDSILLMVIGIVVLVVAIFAIVNSVVISKNSKGGLITGLVLGIIASVGMVVVYIIALLSGNPIIGTWAYSQSEYRVELVIAEDGLARMSMIYGGETLSEDFTWTYNEDAGTFAMTKDGDTQVLQVLSLEDDQMTLSGSDGMLAVFTKVSDDASVEANAGTSGNDYVFGIDGMDEVTCDLCGVTGRGDTYEIYGEMLDLCDDCYEAYKVLEEGIEEIE